MERTKSRKPHAMMIPYPLQGHVIPFVHLAIKLASHGFTITFVNTESIHHQISTAHHGDAGDIFSTSRSSGQLDIRYITVSDGFPLSFDRSLNHDQFFEGILHVFSAHVDDLIAKLSRRNDDPPVTCLIADTFYVWSSMICEKHNLVNVSFWTEPALVLNLYYHMDLLISNGHFKSLDKREDVIDYVPGVKAIDPKDLMSYLQASDRDVDTNTVVYRILSKAFEDVKKADFILCNTVQELEPDSLSALQAKQPVYAIGPVFSTQSIVPTSLWAESDCTEWLKGRPTGSVLYVSFGSYAHVGKKEIVEIAHGLFLSGLSFIWVLRPDIVGSDVPDFLPAGFMEGIEGQGLVVQWCCQMEVISNPAIGGFLTHCGWNSILESVWCGLPLLCYPLLTDQFTNRKLVVDDWRIGINLCEKQMDTTRDEVSVNVRRLMNGETSSELRNNVEKVKCHLKDAITTVGSSETNFKSFLGFVRDKIATKLCNVNGI
uniref:Glycosyltransferase n=1 Tax=Noccaea caerulescens TaxID=107243 RepID=A0A1J3FP70_NOCCA